MIKPPFAKRDIYNTHGQLQIHAYQAVTVHLCSDWGFVIVETTGRAADGYEIKVPRDYIEMGTAL